MGRRGRESRQNKWKTDLKLLLPTIISDCSWSKAGSPKPRRANANKHSRNAFCHLKWASVGSKVAARGSIINYHHSGGSAWKQLTWPDGWPPKGRLLTRSRSNLKAERASAVRAARRSCCCCCPCCWRRRHCCRHTPTTVTSSSVASETKEI